MVELAVRRVCASISQRNGAQQAQCTREDTAAVLRAPRLKLFLASSSALGEVTLPAFAIAELLASRAGKRLGGTGQPKSSRDRTTSEGTGIGRL